MLIRTKTIQAVAKFSPRHSSIPKVGYMSPGIMRTLRYPTNHQVARSGIPRVHLAALSRLNPEKSTDLYLVLVESLEWFGRG